MDSAYKKRHREVAGDSKKDALKRLRELEARLEKKGTVSEKKVPFDFLCDEYLRWTEVNLAPRNRFLSTDEIAKVIAAARADVRPMLQLMIFTGLRKGEIRHLEWSDVDLKNQLIHVRSKETWSPTIPSPEPHLGHLSD